MIKQFFCAFVLLSTIAPATFSQKQLKLEQFPIAAQNQLKQIVATHRTGQVNYTGIENELKASGIDFSNMPIEDAVMMMFMLIANDARKDMKDMLNEMEATRKKKATLREATTLMKKQADSLKNRLQTTYKKDSVSLTKQLNEKQFKLQQFTTTEKVETTSERNIADKLIIAEAHKQSVELSIKELQQKQAKKE